jgi:PQQ-dependent catabolism-associated CXXCW motif protein
MTRRHACVAAVAILFAAGAVAQDMAPEPDSYRTENYRAPVPLSLKGAQVLDTAAAEAIWRAGAAAFIDVLPHPPKPPNLPAGTVWREAPRPHLPGSIWLPDTGYGELADVTETYFKQGLARASGGDRGKQLVFYCQANCWMSWNAAKRALTYGYVNVAWYPEGTDGWRKADLPMVDAKAEPRAGK